MSSLKFSGFRDLERKLKELERTKEVELSELFPPTFLRTHTGFGSLTNMQRKAEAAGFSFESKEEVAAIPGPKWDAFIRKHTSFRTWQDMLNRGGTEYATRKLGLGK